MPRRKRDHEWVNDDYRKIFEDNRAWATETRSRDPERFKRMSEAQNPDYLYIGCSDSRVDETELFNKGAGEIFVHRNIANVVGALDLSAMSVIEYAVRFLKVHHIVVCGHYGCGGVAAAMQPRDMGILNPWLRNIRDVYRGHQLELDALPVEQRARRLVECNVIEQCINVTKTAVVQEAFLDHGYPTVHGWVFDVESGLITDLNLDFEKMLKGIQDLYNLTGQPWYEF